MSPCDICLDKDKCEHPGSCNCEDCDKTNECPKLIGFTPIIRITTRCTQKCTHCCFTCSQERDEMMSIDTAKDIQKFLSNNNISVITLMGGEFFCHPLWPQIFKILIPNKKYVRIVSNGDWADLCPDKITFELKKYDNVKISLSNDKWHTNKSVDIAAKILEENNIRFNIATPDETKDESIVPVGRGELSVYNMFSSFSTYCSNPAHMYSFLIDEDGEVYKCGFGVWDYANIKDYIDGGFSEKFLEIYKIFRRAFVSSCKTCYRAYRRSIHEQKQNKEKNNVD